MTDLGCIACREGGAGARSTGLGIGPGIGLVIGLGIGGARALHAAGSAKTHNAQPDWVGRCTFFSGRNRT